MLLDGCRVDLHRFYVVLNDFGVVLNVSKEVLDSFMVVLCRSE